MRPLLDSRSYRHTRRLSLLDARRYENGFLFEETHDFSASVAIVDLNHFLNISERKEIGNRPNSISFFFASLVRAARDKK